LNVHVMGIRIRIFQSGFQLWMSKEQNATRNFIKLCQAWLFLGGQSVGFPKYSKIYLKK
jgi:hypothetical protein